MRHREELYTFSPEVREAYERLKFPFAVYQFIDEESFVLLISDGYCSMKDIVRFPYTSLSASTAAFIPKISAGSRNWKRNLSVSKAIGTSFTAAGI